MLLSKFYIHEDFRTLEILSDIRKHLKYHSHILHLSLIQTHTLIYKQLMMILIIYMIFYVAHLFKNNLYTSLNFKR